MKITDACLNLGEKMKVHVIGLLILTLQGLCQYKS